jgi:hypothetical protein
MNDSTLFIDNRIPSVERLSSLALSLDSALRQPPKAFINLVPSGVPSPVQASQPL